MLSPRGRRGVVHPEGTWRFAKGHEAGLGRHGSRRDKFRELGNGPVVGGALRVLAPETGAPPGRKQILN